MNFENMPNSKRANGYFLPLASMLIVAIALLVYFWRKGWIFRSESMKQIEKNKLACNKIR
jgi:magnesium transporter